MRRARLITAAAAVLAALALASATFAQDKKVTIKRVPAVNTDPGSGVEMYRTYCAPCHGTEGRGDGPAASALKGVPDLTTLAVRNKGEYPALQVSLVLTGKSTVTAHGSEEMPVWGNIFRSINSDENMIKLRVENLTEYVGKMQKK